jgi:hypothetical protein
MHSRNVLAIPWGNRHKPYPPYILCRHMLRRNFYYNVFDLYGLLGRFHLWLFPYKYLIILADQGSLEPRRGAVAGAGLDWVYSPVSLSRNDLWQAQAAAVTGQHVSEIGFQGHNPLATQKFTDRLESCNTTEWDYPVMKPIKQK